jgi:hypothetical protein
MLGQMLGHLNLVLIFPIPAGVHLFLRLLDRRIGERRYLALMALNLAALVSFSTELALTFVLLGVFTLALSALLMPGMRAALFDAIRPTIAAGLLAAIVTSPLLYYAIKGNIPGAFAGTGNVWGGDLLGFIVPSRVIALGSAWFRTVSSTFTQNDLAESGIYVGLPLVLIVGSYLVSRRDQAIARVLATVLAVVSLLLLGSHLRVDGHQSISLPWRLIGGLPLLQQALPVRLGVYVFLICGVVVAIWVSRSGTTRRTAARWALVALALVFTFPNLRAGLWHTEPSNPSFFTTNQYRHYLRRNEVVLTLPYPGLGNGMLWQADTNMWFRLAGGYLGKLLPSDYQREPIMGSFLDPAVAPRAPDLGSFLDSRHVGAVIVDPANPELWPSVLAQLGLRPVHVEGVLVYRVPPV